jgi:uncharacterized protein YabN with tetrapyrrole methylase and pyrophosphatase domain
MATLLHIIGYGINPFEDLSIGAWQALKTCEQVFSLASSEVSRRFLQEHAIPFDDLSPFYREGRNRARIYREMASHILQKAAGFQRCAYFTAGHPAVLDEPVRQLVARAKRRGIVTRVHAGISFIDYIAANLRLSFDGFGYLMIEATQLVFDRVKVDPRIPLFVAQVGAYNQATARGLSARTPAEFHSLVNYLRKFYPPDHVVTICESEPDGSGFVSCECPVCFLALCAPAFSYRTTVYCPPWRED